MVCLGVCRFCVCLCLCARVYVCGHIDRHREGSRGLGLTVVCLKGLGLHQLTAVTALDQVEVVLRWALAKYGHVCIHRITKQNKNTETDMIIIRLGRHSKRMNRHSDRMNRHLKSLGILLLIALTVYL